MKIFFSTVIIINCLVTTAHAVQKKGTDRIDSLLIDLKKINEDTTKVKLLCDLSRTYYLINPDSGVKYGLEAIDLSEKLSWKKGLASANLCLGINYYAKAEYPKALAYDITSLKLCEELKDKPGIGRAQQNIANVYTEQKNYPKALEHYFKALKLFEESNKKGSVAQILMNIGAAYENQQNESKSLEYHFKALNILEEIGDQFNSAAILNNIGLHYLNHSDYSNALEYFTKALTINKEMVNRDWEAKNLNGIGITYTELAYDINKSHLNKILGGNRTNALKLAKSTIDSSIAITMEIGNLITLLENYKQLSEIESLQGDKGSALESYKNYSSLKDSIFNMEKDKKITETAMQYEFDKKEAATKADQEKKDIRQKNIRNSILAGFTGTFIFLVVVYRQRNKIKAEKKRSDELLLNILPSEVAEELKAKGSADAKQFEEVTVMFTDFKGFTQISESLSPTELVNEIHTCFLAFDNIIGKHNIEKIKTIGDSYMCAGGLPVVNSTHAADVVKAALEIQQFMQQHLLERKNQNKEPFEIRIGIHTGTVVAGIVGVKKFAYDIWGDTVNIASRMESSCEVGKINISGSTYELVKGKFHCTHRGKIEAKNKGEIDMYFVELIG